MSAFVRLDTMRTQVRYRANLESQTAFITNAEINSYLNYWLRDLYDLVVQARGQDSVRKTQSISTVSGTASYSLASDFYQLLSVDATLGTNLVQTLRPYMEADRNRFQWVPGWSYSSPAFYRIIGSTALSGASPSSPSIKFIPTPSGVYTVTVNYVPTFTDLSSDSDTVESFNGWDLYAIFRTVADCQAKGEEDPSYAMGQAADIKQRIASLAGQKDAGNAERVHDIYAGDTYPWGIY